MQFFLIWLLKIDKMDHFWNMYWLACHYGHFEPFLTL